MVNIFIFVLVTIAYYVFLKPTFSLADADNMSSITAVLSNQKWMSLLYFLAVVTIQIIINAMAIVNRCGDSSASNIGSAFTLTFVPWLFIFGIMMGFVMIYPGMKSAFSDVIGYLAVSYSANKLVSDLLVDTDIEEQMGDEGMDDATKGSMRTAAQTIVRILGNMSVLINQVVPANFSSFWKTLIPLMKPKYKNSLDSQETRNLQQQFLTLSLVRDNVGEACWYIYTGVFVIFLVQSYIISYKCDVDPRIMNEKYDDYLAKQKKEAAKEEQANSVKYKM